MDVLLEDMIAEIVDNLSVVIIQLSCSPFMRYTHKLC